MSNMELKRKFDSSGSVSERKKIKDGSILEPEIINFNSVPSLKYIANIKVATLLCSQTDIRDEIKKESIKYYCKGHEFIPRSLNRLESRILKNLSFVHLPNRLKADVANIIMPVLLQMLKCINFGLYDQNDETKYKEYMDSLCWTVEGTIDKVKTFEGLVCKDSAQENIEGLYEFACEYCLEDSIPNLWNKLPKKVQNYYGKSIYKEYNKHLLAYWTSNVQNKLSGLLTKIKPYDDQNIYDCNNSVYRNMFELGIYKSNVLAVKYFWKKLSDEEKNANRGKWIEYSLLKAKMHYLDYQMTNNYSDVLYFLLSQIDDPKHQKEIFEEYSDSSILTLLFQSWPWQRFLLPVLQTIWCSLSEKDYLSLLINISTEIGENKTTEKVLRELWLDSPINLKKSFIQCVIEDHPYGTGLFFKLLAVADVKTIKLILNYASVDERRQIIFSLLKFDKLYDIIYANKLSLIDISETLSSQSDIYNLKAKITQQFGNRLCGNWIYDGNWKRLEEFINWAFSCQSQINHFKINVLDKVEVTYRILITKGDYELVDKFLNWCFSTDQEINRFKRNFAQSKREIVTIGEENWGAFEEFIRWCFICKEDINEFRYNVQQSNKILRIINNNISSSHNRKFADNVIRWCCHSDKEIKEFRGRLKASRRR